MNINLEYYKVFYYIGTYKSITKAADALALSQPAVSLAIKNLEQSLGCRLFVRGPKGVRFTAEGEVLYSYVTRGYHAICMGEKKVREMLDLESGEIRIGASDMTLEFYLLDVLEKFHEKYPKIKVTVTNAPTPETLNHLREGRIDFGVVSTPILSKHEFSVRPVRDIQDVFVANVKFQHLKGHTVTLAELAEFPVICLEGNTSSGHYIRELFRERGLELHPEFELATSDMMIQFALRGLGVASVVRDFALPMLKEGSLFELGLEKKIPARQICVVSDERVPLSAAAQRMMDFSNSRAD